MATDAFGGPPLLHVAGKYPLIRSVDRPARDPARPAAPERFVADHLIVSVRAGLPAGEVQAIAARHGAMVRSRLGALDIYLLATAPERLEILRTGLGTELAVRAADYDRIVSTVVTPDDPQFSGQWGLEPPPPPAGIDAAAAWDIRHDAADVIVAVTDSGIDLTHPDLVGNLWTNPAESAGNGLDDDENGYADDVVGWNFCAGTAVPQDDFFHGTHVAGIIGAEGDNGIGITGVCWRVRLMPLKCLDQNGSGYLSDCVLALDYASANGARIVNCSWGFSGTDTQVADAIERCRARGCLVVAAAGNNGTDNDASPFYPAACANPGLIAVAALDRYGALASFSNYGKDGVGIVAPGVGILSTLPVVPTAAMTSNLLAGGYDTASGTSMAAPFVSGAAALLAEAEPALGPEALADRLRERSPIMPALTGRVNGGRRLDLRALLDPAWIPTQADVVLEDAWFPEVVGSSDGNGFLAAGESAWVQLRLGNHGQTAAGGVTLSLSCDPGLATVSAIGRGPEDLPPGGRMIVDRQFRIRFADGVAPMSTVTLAVTAAWAGGSRTSHHDIVLLSPAVVRPTHPHLASPPAAVIGWGGYPGGGIERFGLTEVDRIYAVSSAFIAQRLDGSLASWGDRSSTGVWNPSDLGRVVKVAVDSIIAVALRDDGTLLSIAYPTAIPAGLTDVADVAVGALHGLALDRAGVVVAWGDDSQGQSDVPADLGPVAAVRAHWFASLAILADGSVRTWGGTTTGSPPGVNDIVDAGIMFTDTVLALRADGSLLCWGAYAGTIQAKLAEWGVTRARRIAVSGGRFAVVDLAGNVRNYGIADGTTLALPPITQPVIDLSVSYANIGLVLADGSVVCAGSDNAGQLRTPAPPPGDVVQIAGSSGGGYLLHAGGAVSEFGGGSWGALAATEALAGVESIASRYGSAFALRRGDLTGFGQVFANTTAGRIVPADVTAVVQAAAGYVGHIALRNDGTVAAWGDAPLPSPELRFRQVAYGYGFGVGVTVQGQAEVWPRGWNGWTLPDRAVRVACGFQQLLVLRDDGTVVCEGAPQPPEPLSDVVDIACGQSFCMALTASGRVVLWSIYPDASLDVPVAVDSVQAISAGDWSAYAVLPAKAAAGISLFDTVIPYDGRPHLPRATTTPPGLMVQHLVDGGSALPIAPGSYAIQATIDSWGYSGQASCNLSIHGVAIQLDSAAPALVTGPFQVDVACSEPVDGLAATALAIRNCTIASIAGGGAHWQIQVVPTADGEIGIRVRDLACRTAAGVRNAASAELVRRMDRTRPTPTLAAVSPLAFTVSWDEPVQGFAPLGSLVVDRGSIASAVPTDHTGLHWQCVVEAPAGPVAVRLAETAATDLAGNPSRASATLVLPGTAPADPFTMKIMTGNPGTSGSAQFTLPLDPGHSYDFTIDWGDATMSVVTDSTSPTHTYPAPGVYVIGIGANAAHGFPAIRFADGGDKLKLLEITRWGDVAWSSLKDAFRGCSNLRITATDAVADRTRDVTDFSAAWSGCSSLTSFPLLNTAAGTDFTSAWQGCSGLVDFPRIDTAMGEVFDSTWAGCTGLSVFPPLNMGSMVDGTSCFGGVVLARNSYSDLLNALAAQNGRSDVRFDGGGSTYGTDAALSHAALTGPRGWTITDGGLRAAPTVTSLSVASGPESGGTATMVAGTGLNGATVVTFDGAPATSVVVVDDTAITCVTPAGTAGAAAVVVTTPGGDGMLAAGFMYVVAGGAVGGGGGSDAGVGSSEGGGCGVGGIAALLLCCLFIALRGVMHLRKQGPA